MPVSLGELAISIGCELIGDPDVLVSDVATLDRATPQSLTFLANSAYTKQLPLTKAAAVVLRVEDVDACPVAAFVTDNPYATYALMAALVCPEAAFEPGVHDTAIVELSASVASSAYIAANVVIGERTTIGENTFIGPGTIIGPDCRVGDNCRLVANVNLVKRVKIGDRGLFHPGVVIGSDGFGNVMAAEGWVKVPQLGGVSIGNDVEIGSNTTVDCGTIGDTVIKNGARIDNLCMIAHNVHVGEHTAIASATTIAGSTKIGDRCLFGGRSGAVGHLSICDDVILLSRAVLTKNVTTPGTYSGSFPAELSGKWAKKVARFRRLGNLIERVKKLE
ncbi:MAG: UDP-3-O-(3-hydroxymyristoyl)glucosamine N-acyltransferase [Woeseiaceae bacterium]|nr:UDP-3-O-(3-hydroxymyristoyl)glucosamine N-acyltransferase [Woeseiaceae bacterium]